MAYFDSAKNRALWQEELNGLTAERERRKNGERPGRETGRGAAGTGNPLVQKITFAQLLAEREAAAGRKVRTASPSLTREMTKTQRPEALSPRHKKSV